MAGLALPRGLRPAPRLVPLLAPGELRHARPGTLRRRADPRLRRRCRRPQDVEVPGQRRLADRPDEDPRCRHPAPVGGQRRLHRGSAHRQGDPGRHRRHLPPPAQHPALPAGQPRRLHRGRAARRTTRCPSSSAGCCTGWPSSTSRSAAATASSTIPKLVRPSCTISAPTTCRRSISTSARTRSTATRSTARAAGPRAPCSTSCSGCLTAWLAPVLVLHHRGGVAHALPERGQRAPAHLPRAAGRLARPGPGCALGADPRGPPRGHRRARARAQGEADRRQPAGGTRRPPAAGRPASCWPASIWPSSRSPAASTLAEGEAPADAFTLDEVPGVAVVPGLADGREMRALLAGPGGGRGLARASVRALHRCGRHLARGLKRWRTCGGPLLAVAILVLDQATKWLALASLDPYQYR